MPLSHRFGSAIVFALTDGEGPWLGAHTGLLATPHLGEPFLEWPATD